MTSWKLRLAVPAAVVVALASTTAFASAARQQAPQSQPTSRAGTLDPRHLPAKLPHGVFRASDSRVPTALAGMTTTNGLIISDLAIYVSDGSSFTSLVAEGHLNLVNDHNAHYAGTFVDNLSGASIFKASASHIQPTGLNGNYTIYTGNGKFTFNIGPGFTSTVPLKYGRHASIGTILYGTHAYTQRPPLTASFSSFTIGGFNRPASGTLTLTTDAIGYIVPFSTRRHVNSSWTYTYAGHLHAYRINSYGHYFPADGAGDGSLTAVLQVNKTIFHVIDARETTGGTRTFTADALAGSGDSTSQSTFSAH